MKRTIACFRMPKVASLSLHTALCEKCNMIHHAAETIHGEIVRKYRRENPDAFIFSFVRNPFDRLVSSYHWMSRLKENKKTSEWKKHVDPYKGNFADFVVNEIGEGRGVEVLHLRTQHSWIAGLDGKLMVDWVGKFENLQGDLVKLCGLMGWSVVRLEKSNESVHRDYKGYYTSELEKIVARAYEKDFELGGYPSSV